MKIVGNKIIWDTEDWLAGLHPQYGESGNPYPPHRNFQGLGYSRSMNPFRFLGNLCPGYQAADVTNVSLVDSALLNAVAAGANFYTGGGGKLHVGSVGTGALTNDVAGTGFPHTINHSHNNEFFRDIITYNAKIGGTSALRYFYSFGDDTDWDVGVFTPGSPATFDDDFMSTAPATPLAAPYITGGKSAPHPMKVGDDDILYIGDRNFLHAYDGQSAADDDGKFYPAVMTLPNNYIITSFAKIENYLVVYAYYDSGATNYLSEAKAFFYDYLSLDPTKSFILDDNYVIGGFEYKGTVGCFTSARRSDPRYSRNSRIKLFDGTKFVTLVEYVGGTPVNGGIEVFNDMIQWAASDGSAISVFSYGSPFQGVKSGLNKLAEGSGNAPGFLKTFSSSYQFLSSGTTTSGGLQSINSNYYFNSSVTTQLAEPVFPIGMKGKIKNVKIQWTDAVKDGRAVSVYIRDRAANGCTIVNKLEDITSPTFTTEYVCDVNGAALPDFDAVRFIIAWTGGTAATVAPKIARIEVEFELIYF